MGLGAGTIELYRQLKLAGVLDGITEVMELGSQDYWCPQRNLLRAYFEAFGREADPSVFDATPESQKPARLVYEGVGIKYGCVDVDGRPGTVELDLNFDTVPNGEKEKYGLVTNHGTSEHVINQNNIFKVMHDFARVGGVFVHAVPFMGYLDHGFFSYHPNFFNALARYNSYEMVGMWIGLSSHLPTYIPWDINMLECLSMSPKSTFLLIAVMRKMYKTPFCVPFQGVYEDMIPDKEFSRYRMVVDAEVMDALRVKHLSTNGLITEAWNKPSGAVRAAEADVQTETKSVGVMEAVPVVAPASSELGLVSLRDVRGSELLAELRFRVRRRLRMLIGEANQS